MPKDFLKVKASQFSDSLPNGVFLNELEKPGGIVALKVLVMASPPSGDSVSLLIFPMLDAFQLRNHNADKLV